MADRVRVATSELAIAYPRVRVARSRLETVAPPAARIRVARSRLESIPPPRARVRVATSRLESFLNRNVFVHDGTGWAAGTMYIHDGTAWVGP